MKEWKREEATRNEPRISLQGHEIVNVARAKCLGATVVAHGGSNEEIRARCEKAFVAFHQLRQIWADRKLPQSLKLQLYKVRVLSMLLYGGESWTLTGVSLKMLRNLNARCLSFMLGGRPSAAELLQQHRCAELVDVMDMLEERRWRWLGKVFLMDESRLPKKALVIAQRKEGSLLAHLPPRITVHNGHIFARDRSSWNDVYFKQRVRFKDMHLLST